MATKIIPTGVARHFDSGEILVSKTDLKGKITYCNAQFRDIAGYGNEDLIDQPHSCVRHPDMPRVIFKVLWQALEAKREIFAYVKNMSSNGDHYWVFAHVTPSFDSNGEVVGYHSSRRSPNNDTLTRIIEPLYRDLLMIEQRESNRKVGLQESSNRLADLLNEKNTTYDQFILTL